MTVRSLCWKRLVAGAGALGVALLGTLSLRANDTAMEKVQGSVRLSAEAAESAEAGQIEAGRDLATEAFTAVQRLEAGVVVSGSRSVAARSDTGGGPLSRVVERPAVPGPAAVSGRSKCPFGALAARVAVPAKKFFAFRTEQGRGWTLFLGALATLAMAWIMFGIAKGADAGAGVTVAAAGLGALGTGLATLIAAVNPFKRARW